VYSLVSLGDVRIKMETLLNSLGGKGGVIFYFFVACLNAKISSLLIGYLFSFNNY